VLVHIIDDLDDLAQSLAISLQTHGIDTLTTTDDFDSLLTDKPWAGVDAALVDLHLDACITGLDLLKWLALHQPQIRRVAFTANPIGDQLIPLAHAALQKPAATADVIAALQAPA
jgi:ActR/RegA family two-component response regulator